MAHRLSRALLLVLLAFAACSRAAEGPLVFAASSLQESLTAAADRWAAKGHPKPAVSFAASSALARQVESGAPADVFVSADEEWMTYLATRNLIQPRSRVSFLTNSLVLVAPAASRVRIAIGPRMPLARTLGQGRLAMADPRSVPAGKYAREALTKLGVWESVSAKIAGTENVRAALLLVSRGEAPFGIVYRTDAMIDPNVKVIDTFPETTHAPIVYPAALTTSSTAAGARVLEYLKSAAARAVFDKAGFTAPRN